MNISVVIPLLNESESLPELYDWIASVMQSNRFLYEVIFVDDGSTDASWSIIEKLSEQHSEVKGIRFSRNFGKSQALHAGFAKAQGDVVITMDADLQDSPDEIPELYEMVSVQGYDLVSGWKQKRYDSKIRKNIPSKLFNWAARKASSLELNDFNCGLKAYKNEVVKNINVYGEMHRYIPVLAKNAGFNHIGEKVVQHQARKYGETKFGIDRFINGFLDLITISFISKFGKRPMHLFGGLGSIMFLIGLILASYIGIKKLFYVFYLQIEAPLVTSSAWFYISLTSMVIGSQLFIAGFLGELILKSQEREQRYYINKEV
ncbi:MAG: glycosyltransferase family 2 protein [Flavobacteriaceae bacterium]